MDLQFAVALVALLVAMALAVARAVAGPTVFDRILAANAFGTKTVLLIAVYGFMTERPEFLDLGLVYALINFIGIVAALKFFKFGAFDDRSFRDEGGQDT
jgi:multicomponent Na+:H+ antiporter subunit F